MPTYAKHLVRDADTLFRGDPVEIFNANNKYEALFNSPNR